MYMTGQVCAYLIDGLPGGNYNEWWHPDTTKTLDAAAALYELAHLPDLGGAPVPQAWARVLGYELHPDDSYAYGLLEITGMNAQQFCAFWSAVEDIPGLPPASDRAHRNSLVLYSYRLVINTRFPESLHFGHQLPLYGEALERGLRPLELLEWDVLPDYAGRPSRLR